MLHSVKVYKTQFRNWGIRKNLKGHEALDIAAGQGSSTAFWPENRVDEYAARVDRHVKSKNPHNDIVLRAHIWRPIRDSQAMNPPRTLDAPDALRKLEAANYHLHLWFTGTANWKATWFVTGPSFGEQEAFSSLFIAGIERLSRNDQPQQAFRDINLAFDHVKQLVSRDHPMVYMRLISSIFAFSQYPKSEVCSTVCRTLSDFVGKVTGVVHGPKHPLNHFWGESLHISSMEGPESFSLGVAATLVRRCMPNELRIAMGSIDIATWVPSDARDLDEASLRHRITTMASCPDMLSQAQEARLALCELLVAKMRMTETFHFFAEARAFQDADPLRRASKTFWMAELEWRSGNAQGSIMALKLALELDDITAAGEMNIEFTGELKREIENVLRDRQDMMASRNKIEDVTPASVGPTSV